MTHIASLAQIGKACGGISKQAVAKYVASGVLLRGPDGINIEDPQNRQWLLTRGADMTVFYGAAAAKTPPPKTVTPTAGTPAAPVAPAGAPQQAGQKRKNQHDAPQQMVFKDRDGNEIPANTAIFQQKFMASQVDTSLKQLKLLTAKGMLFERRVVNNVVAGVMSEMVNVAMSVPQAIVDNIMNAMVISPDSARDVIVRLLQDAYLHEYRLIGQTIKKKLSNMRNERPNDNGNQEEKTA